MKSFIAVCLLVTVVSAENMRDKRGYLSGGIGAYNGVGGYQAPAVPAPSLPAPVLPPPVLPQPLIPGSPQTLLPAPVLQQSSLPAPLLQQPSLPAPAASVVTVNRIINVHRVVEVPQVINVRKIITVPQVITENRIIPAPNYAPYGATSYGSGL